MLELLAVVSVMAVIAGAVIFNLTGTQSDAVERISHGEIATIASKHLNGIPAISQRKALST